MKISCEEWDGIFGLLVVLRREWNSSQGNFLQKIDVAYLAGLSEFESIFDSTDDTSTDMKKTRSYQYVDYYCN